jgi:hypothetical protein
MRSESKVNFEVTQMSTPDLANTNPAAVASLDGDKPGQRPGQQPANSPDSKTPPLTTA